MKKNHKKNLKQRLLAIKYYYVAALALGISLLASRDSFLSIAIAAMALFSWRIYQEDLGKYRVNNWNLIGLAVAGLLAYQFGAKFEISIIRSLIVFIIGWGIFQLFEGDIGGGDVRLITVIALFLNIIQVLSLISVAAAVGLVIGAKYKVKRVPFGSFLISFAWVVFGIVRY